MKMKDNNDFRNVVFIDVCLCIIKIDGIYLMKE